MTMIALERKMLNNDKFGIIFCWIGILEPK